MEPTLILSAADDQERDLIACLNRGKLIRASLLLANLQADFPDSPRVARLQAKVYSAKGLIDQAKQLCEKIISNDPTDVSTWKTFIACLKGAGRIEAASKSLLELLNLIPSDICAWLELADLYIRQRQFSYAGFVMEEIILLQPACYSSYLMYAEILFSMGTKKTLEQSRQYYAMSIELNPYRNPRALYGLLMVMTFNAKSLF